MTTLDDNPSTGTHVQNETTEEFAARMVGAIDAASVAILASIGHQTGLFDTMAELPSATSSQIADAAGLNERYVREWLGGMVTGLVVDYDPRSGLYSLPSHRAAVLTRAAGPDNLARVAQFIPLLGEIEQKVIQCFRRGGGLPYTEYPRFHAIMAEDSGEVFDAALVLCPEGCRRCRSGGVLRRHHCLRRDPRPGRSGQGPRQHLPSASARRRVVDG